MNYTQYLKYLTVKRLLGLLLVLFYLIFTTEAIAIVVHLPPYNVSDKVATDLLKDEIMPSFDRLVATFKNSNDIHKKVNDQLTKADNSLQNINTEYKKNIDLAIAWAKNTDPNLVQLKLLLKPIMKDLETLDIKAKGDLDAYEDKSFLNTKAHANRVTQYGKSDTVTLAAMTLASASILSPGDVMCQKTLSSTSDTYAHLQESSCIIVHNATAYKKILYDFTLQKQDLLKKATKIIMDSSLVTVGEHDARKTMLLELKLLQQETADDFKLRLNNADMRVQIARDTEVYAAQAISFGVNSSVVMEAAKGLIGTAITGGTAQIVPYNK